MNVLRSIVTWIDSFESGSQFRKWTAILLRIMGILAIIATVVGGIAIYVGSIYVSEVLDTVPLIFNIIGSLISLCLNVFLGLVLIMLFWNRSNKIRNLNDLTQYEILPIAVILIRLVGEVGFITLVVSGIQGLISSIFGTGFHSVSELIMFNFVQDVNINPITGIIMFVVSIIGGALFFIVHYCVAALINIIVDIATNQRKNNKTLSPEETPSNPDE